MNKTILTGIFGANGRMGRALIEAHDQEREIAIGSALVRPGSSFEGIDIGEIAGIGKQGVYTTSNPSDLAQAAQVMIDFTLPAALDTNLATCIEYKLPVVIGTTGLSDGQKLKLREAAEHIPIVFAPNMSVGVNLMLNLVQQVAAKMGETADIEIWEAHHRFKRDAPSGTAMAIGEAIAQTLGRDLGQCAVYGREGDTGERKPDTIGFATIRAGDVVGEHTAMFADLGERLEITHKASSRLTFAKGAVRAAKWLVGKPVGLYDMQDVLGLK